MQMIQGSNGRRQILLGNVQLLDVPRYLLHRLFGLLGLGFDVLDENEQLLDGPLSVVQRCPAVLGVAALIAHHRAYLLVNAAYLALHFADDIVDVGQGLLGGEYRVDVVHRVEVWLVQVIVAWE